MFLNCCFYNPTHLIDHFFNDNDSGILGIKISDTAQCLMITQSMSMGKSGWVEVEGKILDSEDFYEPRVECIEQTILWDIKNHDRIKSRRDGEPKGKIFSKLKGANGVL